MGPYLISDLVKGQSVVATWNGEAELYAAVSVMKDMIIGLNAKRKLRLDSSAACAMLERQGAGLRVKDRNVAVRAQPTRTCCSELGTRVHSVARSRGLLT